MPPVVKTLIYKSLTCNNPSFYVDFSHLHGGFIYIRRVFIPQGLMRSFVVVFCYERRYCVVNILCCFAFGKVKLFVFKAPEKELYNNVISRSRASVHTVLYSIGLQQVYVFIACKLAALVTIDDFRFYFCKCFHKSPDNKG